MELAVLENVGLSKREAKVYLALLDLGSTTIGPIVERTDIPSSKIYEVLGRLEEKGLANHIIIKHQKHFQGANPQIILDQLETKQEQFQAHLATLQQRQALAQEKQYAEFYEGKEAIFSLLRSIVRSAKQGEEYYSFSLGEQHQDEDIALFYKQLLLLDKEKELFVRVIFPLEDKKIIETTYSKDHLQFIHARYSKMKFPEGITILGDDVVLVEWEGEPSAVRIKSKTHAKNYKKFFNELYEQAHEEHKGMHYVG